MGVLSSSLASTELLPAAQKGLSEAAGNFSVEPLFYRGSISFTGSVSSSASGEDAIVWNRAKSSPGLQFAHVSDGEEAPSDLLETLLGSGGGKFLLFLVDLSG